MRSDDGYGKGLPYRSAHARRLLILPGGKRESLIRPAHSIDAYALHMPRMEIHRTW